MNNCPPDHWITQNFTLYCFQSEKNTFLDTFSFPKAMFSSNNSRYSQYKTPHHHHLYPHEKKSSKSLTPTERLAEACSRMESKQSWRICIQMLGCLCSGGSCDAAITHQDTQWQAVNDKLIHQDRLGAHKTSPNHNRSAELRLPSA